MFEATRDDEDLPRGQRDGLTIGELDPERALPAQEQLVLLVVVPGELAFDRRDADDGIVHLDEVPRFERPFQLAHDVGDRDRRSEPLGVAHVTLSAPDRGWRLPMPWWEELETVNGAPLAGLDEATRTRVA
jgi:hypothetical protein